MQTRRGFLKGAANTAAGIVFCSCGLLDAAHAKTSADGGARRLPITVRGKRIKTIDVHSHCLFHESLNMMGDEAKGVLQNVKGVPDQ
ncbi:MAG TPA: twin-arginine translocation signal domain-containing protein, partial [Pseudolabrys sp.]|nr:twin-arginine translocation signal domain-containing protein [Pseudolabrys sp.]